MGIWTSEKTLVSWIKSKWKPKGQVDLKLGSKGFFTTIFPALRIGRESSKKVPTSSTLQGFTCTIGQSNLASKIRILLKLLFGFVCTLYPKSFRKKKP
jgi:hypothetical protein